MILCPLVSNFRDFGGCLFVSPKINNQYVLAPYKQILGVRKHHASKYSVFESICPNKLKECQNWLSIRLYGASKD